ncbi:hypothetical protein [Thalassotalea marina]|uniref:Uncharacterized protein n=1 Tax=Thalassotalea marina TaxID=1673741 RepID=A0A919BFZ1_9GAMM|nr:hypothetical protein [Thalassotalea marina]GHF87075.1 hypothetical protein GCM10017161_13220 [Thalassotalea marina]
MNNRKKALILNLLLCPGAGQLVLKRFKRAILFITIFLITVVYFFSTIVSKIQPLVDKVMAGQLMLTQQAIADEMSKNPIYFDLVLGQQLMIIILSVWLVAIIDGMTVKNKK